MAAASSTHIGIDDGSSPVRLGKRVPVLQMSPRGGDREAGFRLPALVVMEPTPRSGTYACLGRVYIEYELLCARDVRPGSCRQRAAARELILLCEVSGRPVKR